MCLLETLTLVTTVFMARCILTEEYRGAACLMVLVVIQCCMWANRYRRIYEAQDANERLKAEFEAKQQQSGEDYSNDF